MHELALARSVVEIALEEARKAGARRVRRIRLDIGELSCVEAEAIEFCFFAVTAGTAAEGAALEIARPEGAGWCADCSRTIVLHERFAPCPDCGGGRVRMTSGDELRIRDMEVE